jgi:CRISPR-associated endonuclease/helicase Cas3
MNKNSILNVLPFIAHQRETDGVQQSLEAHLSEVADIAKSCAEKVGLASQAELIGLLHDLGKYSAAFQTYIKSAVGLIDPDEDDYVDAKGLKGKIDHSTAGAQLVWEALSKQGDMGRIVGQILALCIVSHHSGLIDCLSSDTNSPPEDKFTKRIRKQDDRTHFCEAVSKMDAQINKRFLELVNSPELIDGLKLGIQRVMVRDDIKGLKLTNNPIVQFKLGLLVRFLFSCLIDADRVNTADFEKPKAAKHRLNSRYAEWPILIERLERHLQKFVVQNPVDQKPVDEIRRSISDHCLAGATRDKGIYTLTVPTGGGKTLASLRFALHHAKNHKMDRIIYVIPYTSIIDQNAKAVRDILEPTKEDRGRVVLEHHSNLTPEQQGWKEKMLTENWDAPVVFTTSVQLLEALFGGGTRGARRMHQLANSVLIFDEIQTLPVNCVHLFCNAMNFLVEQCGSTVVLCTATQPLLNLVDPSKGAMKFTKDDDLMPDVQGLFDKLKRVEILNQRKPGGWNEIEVARLAMTEVEQSGSSLVIVNTKTSALALYKLCREATKAQTFHLSTSMCPAHRKKILDEIRQRLDDKSPLLCISTQLIEAGVDVDFGSVIRYTAGLDSIVQAAGRCNRNGKQQDADGNPKAGRVHVVNPAAENIDMLKDIQCGKENTERILSDVDAGIEDFGGDLLAPEAMARYFDYYFFARRQEMDYPVSAEMVGRADTLLNLLSVNAQSVHDYGINNNSAPNIYFRQSFMAAARAFKVIDAATRGIIVPYDKAGRELIADLCAAFEVEKQFKLLRRAQQYTVNVFPYQLEQLQKAGALHAIQEGVDIMYLDTRYYSEEFGLSLSPEGLMEAHYV